MRKHVRITWVGVLFIFVYIFFSLEIVTFVGIGKSGNERWVGKQGMYILKIFAQ